MAEGTDGVELSIDTAGAIASVAISRHGALLAEHTWRTHNSHSTELLPAIDDLLARASAQREEIRVIFVDRGPGSYAGLRVGISTAMGLALSLSADLLAAGRLELDAFPHAAFRGPVVPVHQAGRGDLAWAVYEQRVNWSELEKPRLGTLHELIAAAPGGALFCGELAGLRDQIEEALPGARFAGGDLAFRHADTLAELCWSRYSAGMRDNPLAVEPLYLREAHITQPKPRATFA
jgi:tRNA threonylcarbamoyladenosine biosynthesis protein TsaB